MMNEKLERTKHLIEKYSNQYFRETGKVRVVLQKDSDGLIKRIYTDDYVQWLHGLVEELQTTKEGKQ